MAGPHFTEADKHHAAGPGTPREEGNEGDQEIAGGEIWKRKS